MSAETQTDQTAQLAETAYEPSNFDLRLATDPLSKKKNFNFRRHSGLAWSGWCFEYRRASQTVRQVFVSLINRNIKYETKECISVKDGRDDDYTIVYIKLQDNPSLSF